MSDPASQSGALTAVLDLLALLAEARQRSDQASSQRGKSAKREFWRELISRPPADPFPRRLALLLRTAREKAGPFRKAIRSMRPDGYAPASRPGPTAASATEWVLSLAEDVLQVAADVLPPAPARTWMADDEVDELAARLRPLLAGVTDDVGQHVRAEFGALDGESP